VRLTRALALPLDRTLHGDGVHSMGWQVSSEVMKFDKVYFFYKVSHATKHELTLVAVVRRWICC
jgi:hypothetical protein